MQNEEWDCLSEPGCVIHRHTGLRIAFQSFGKTGLVGTPVYTPSCFASLQDDPELLRLRIEAVDVFRRHHNFAA